MAETLTGAAMAVASSCYEDLRGRYGHAATTAQAADELQMSKSHVRAMCESGELPAVRLGSRWRIPTAKLAAILDGEGVDA